MAQPQQSGTGLEGAQDLLKAREGLYLQQLSKLKLGGIELEKTTEATTKVIGSLGISR